MKTPRLTMHATRSVSARFLYALAGLIGASAAWAQTADYSFTYQGELRNNDAPATGTYDLRLEFLDAASTVLQTFCADNTQVSNGRFTVRVSPGDSFPSQADRYRFVRISVRADTGQSCSNNNGYVTLLPVQAMTAAPLATRAYAAATAENASTLAGLSAGYLLDLQNHTGTLPVSSLGPTVPRTDTSNVFSGTNTFASIQTSGGIENPGGPLVLRTNGDRGLVIDARSGTPNIIAGSSSNSVLLPAYGSAISGGTTNQISARFANIGGGSGNVVSSLGDNATIGGGAGNQAQAFTATIGGGYYNTVNNGSGSVISGGAFNAVTASWGTIGGGASTDFGDFSNTNNRVTDDYGVVGGGGGNRAGNSAGAVDDARYATVGGGRNNRASGPFSGVGSGDGNIASAQYAIVSGGVNNTASGGGFSTIAGGSGNSASGFVATVSGGDFNVASGDRSTVSGGYTNQTTGPYATVSGGYGNLASAYISTVGGGDANTASGDRAVVSGGYSSLASGPFATIAGGIYNQATAYGATVVGGDAGIASGQWSSVLGGIDNQATQIGSFAGGTRTRAIHEGAFVWSDRSNLGGYTTSTAPNQVTVRAGGGVQIIGNVGVTGNINFAAPRQTFRMYSVGEFLPATRNSVDVPVRTGFYGELIAGPNGSSITFRVPLNLPQGARVVDVRVYYNDNDASRFMRFSLLRTTLPSQSATAFGVTTTEAAPGSQQTAVLSFGSPFVIDNQTSSLEFVVEPLRPISVGWVTEWSSSLQIAGMRLTYETDGPTQ